MRYNGILFLVLAIVIAGVSTWLLDQWRTQQVFREKLDTSQIDYYLSGFSLYITDKEGNRSFDLSADHFVHQRVSKTNEIYKPVITVTHKNETLNIVADKAAQEMNDDMRLEGKVTIDKPESETSTGFSLQTSNIHYSPSKQLVNTDAKVILKTIDGSIITALGMSEDLLSQTTRLTSNVHAEYIPAAATTSE